MIDRTEIIGAGHCLWWHVDKEKKYPQDSWNAPWDDQ